MTEESNSNLPPRTAPTMPVPQSSGYEDEISLRDLYLILRRGLPVILGLTLVAAVAAFGYVSLQPDAYEAEATVVSSPTVVQAQGSGALAFAPSSSIAFETYEAIATSRSAFEEALNLLQADGIEAPAAFQALRGAAALERLSGPSGTTNAGSLTVIHRVTWSDPDLSAAYADAWAAATVNQVRATLLADLEPTREQMLTTIASTEADLLAAERAYEAFIASDPESVRQALSTARSRFSQITNTLAQLDATSARLSGEVASLVDLIGTGARGALTSEAIDFLLDMERIDPETAASLRLTAPAGALAASDATELLARTDLQLASTALAGVLEQRLALLADQEELTRSIQELTTRLADIDREERAVLRALRNAEAAYEAVQVLEPALAFVTDLTPSNTRIINAAQAPISATGMSSLLVALLAAVVAGMASTLFVFLREAVREPANEAAA